MSLGENIKKYRLEKKLTQEQLANILHVSSQAVSKWECNENFPDGTLLVPLANTLEVSLDRLFENKKVTLDDVSKSLATLIQTDNGENEYELVENICWHMQNYLFYNTEENIREILPKNDSYNLRENGGFTCFSKRDSSTFFAVFPEPKCGWDETIQDGEKARKIFECFADKDTMNAVMFIYKNEFGYIFEKEFLCEKCGISEEEIDKVIRNLRFLNIIFENKTRIDNKEHILYEARPTHRVISLFLVANDFYHRGGYSVQVDSRRKPYFKQ